jgi:hypothetical protein
MDSVTPRWAAALVKQDTQQTAVQKNFARLTAMAVEHATPPLVCVRVTHHFMMQTVDLRSALKIALVTGHATRKMGYAVVHLEHTQERLVICFNALDFLWRETRLPIVVGVASVTSSLELVFVTVAMLESHVQTRY